ncbi:MAG: hypothetical protein PHV82_02485, partial [Victivallaceae bacterium]|nr:hypothetical protein [Victivallaceae bacterium]
MNGFILLTAAGNKYVDYAYWRPDFERAKTAWVKEFGREGGENYMYAGAWHIYLKNPDREPLFISEIIVNGKNVGKIYPDADQMPYQEYPPASFPEEIPLKDFLWFRVLPNPVPPGGMAEVIIRPRLKPEGEKASIILVSAKGVKIPVTITYKKPALILSSISFSKDLTRIYCYVRKMIAGELAIKRVFLNGAEVTADSFIPEKKFIKAVKVKYPAYTPPPSIYNDLAPITVHLKKAQSAGALCIIRVETTDGESTAYMVRAFPQEFPLQLSWPRESNYEKTKDGLFDICMGFSGPEGKAYYDRLQQLGLKGFTGGDAFYQNGNRKYYIFYGPERTIPILEETKNHPALWGHFIMDEPNGCDMKMDATSGDNLGILAAECNRIYLFCLKHSPGKPVGVAIANGYNPMGSCVYGEISDFCYHHGYYYQLIPAVLNVLETKEAAQPHPVYHVPFLGWWKVPGRHEWITPETMRIWCYETVAAGCKGFMYYPAH